MVLRELRVGTCINQSQLNIIQMTLEEYKAISERTSKKAGVTSRIIIPGEEELTNKTTITFVKDASKRRDLNPNFGKEPDKMAQETRRKAGRLTEAERRARQEETIEHVIQDIMKNRGVSREEAEEIFNRPF